MQYTAEGSGRWLGWDSLQFKKKKQQQKKVSESFPDYITYTQKSQPNNNKSQRFQKYIS